LYCKWKAQTKRIQTPELVLSTPDSHQSRANPTSDLVTWANRCPWTTSTGPKSLKPLDFTKIKRNPWTNLKLLRLTRMASRESLKAFKSRGLSLLEINLCFKCNKFNHKIMITVWLINYSSGNSTKMRIWSTWMAQTKATSWTSLISRTKNQKFLFKDRHLVFLRRTLATIRGMGPIQGKESH
jgi:hypothetical protein